MIKAVIIEDEKKAAGHLATLLCELEPEISIVKIIESVSEGKQYFANSGKVDVIFSDVQLADGLSFSIFESVISTAPVVFITGYDEYRLHAFENNGIDYLVKPTSREALHKALKKYKSLKHHFMAGESEVPTHQPLPYINTNKRRRILVRQGIENITMPLEDVVLFYTEHKVVQVIDGNGHKFMVDKNLSDLEQELDEKTFFRVNRQYILNINFIKSFQPYERVKLWVNLRVNAVDHRIIVSQETAPFFRRWLLEA